MRPYQVEEWFPEIAEALNEFVTNEQNELLALMLDAKEGADNGLLPIFQHIIRQQIDPQDAIQEVNEYGQYVNQQQQQQQNTFNDQNMMQSHPGSAMNTVRGQYAHHAMMLPGLKTPSVNQQNLASLYGTPIGNNQYGMISAIFMNKPLQFLR